MSSAFWREKKSFPGSPLNSFPCQYSQCHPAILSWGQHIVSADFIQNMATYSSASPVHYMCYSVFIATYGCPWGKSWSFQTRALVSFFLRLPSAHSQDMVPLSLHFYSWLRKWPIVHGNTIIGSTWETFQSSHPSLPWSRHYPLEISQMAMTGSLEITSVTLGRGQKKSTSTSLLLHFISN